VNERKSQGRAGKPGAATTPAAPKAAAAAKAAETKAAETKAAETKAAETKVSKPKAAPKAAPAQAKAAEPSADPHARKVSFKRTLIGHVKSDKMNKTIVVEVIRSKLDPVYKKYVRVRKTYQAHDEENTCRVGDRVEIIEHRPLSKLKRWKLLNLVERAVQG